VSFGKAMNHAMQLESLLADKTATAERPAAVFAFLCLGVIESLANGLMTATDGVRLFFDADNCLYVRKEMRDKLADKIMSHGVQLPDLFTVLPAEEAHREFQHELSTMRALCLKLLDEHKRVA
jgi:hypothetical protein